MSPRHPKKLSASERRSDKGRFALRLAELLEERGWTSETLAARIGIGEPAVRRWLRAEVMPQTLGMLRKIGRSLDTEEHPFPDYRMILPE